MIHLILNAIDKPYIDPLNEQARRAYSSGIVRGLIFAACMLFAGIVIGELIWP